MMAPANHAATSIERLSLPWHTQHAVGRSTVHVLLSTTPHTEPPCLASCERRTIREWADQQDVIVALCDSSGGSECNPTLANDRPPVDPASVALCFPALYGDMASALVGAGRNIRHHQRLGVSHTFLYADASHLYTRGSGQRDTLLDDWTPRGLGNVSLFYLPWLSDFRMHSRGQTWQVNDCIHRAAARGFGWTLNIDLDELVVLPDGESLLGLINVRQRDDVDVYIFGSRQACNVSTDASGRAVVGSLGARTSRNKPLVRTGRVWTFGIHGPGQCKAGKCQVKELSMHRHSIAHLGDRGIRLAYPNMPGPRARIREQQSLLGQAATTSFSRPSREDPACSSATSPATSGCGILGTHGVLACCPESCGTCGGAGCELRQGGRTCCAGFAASHGPCGATGAPCKPARAAQAACCPGRRLARGLATAAGEKPQRPRRDATSKRKTNGQGSEHGTPAELRLRTNCTEPTAQIDSWQERTGIHFHVTVLALQLAACCGGSAVVPANIELRAPKPRCFSFASLANRSGACDANVSRRQSTMGFVYAGHALLPLHCRSAAWSLDAAFAAALSYTGYGNRTCPSKALLNDTLVVQLRSGDLFRRYSPHWYGYQQPPLAFYLAAWRASGMANMRVVCEDLTSPVAQSLRMLSLHHFGSRITFQTGAFADALDTLRCAPHLAVSNSNTASFAVAVNRRIARLFVWGFKRDPVYSAWKNGRARAGRCGAKMIVAGGPLADHVMTRRGAWDGTKPSTHLALLLEGANTSFDLLEHPLPCVPGA